VRLRRVLSGPARPGAADFGKNIFNPGEAKALSIFGNSGNDQDGFGDIPLPFKPEPARDDA